MEFDLGDRHGGYVILRDSDSGSLIAVRPTSVLAILETDGRTVLLLPGGRMAVVDCALVTVLTWLSL